MSRPQTQTAIQRLRQHLKFSADDFRLRLAHIDALPQLTLLGLITGLISALVIVAFRFLVDISLESFLPDHSENFEALSYLWRFSLPFLGAVIIGLSMQCLKKENHQISVGHVLDRLHNHQGQLPFINWLVQFFGGALSLITGQSVGREGPAVHLGAGIASQLGQRMKLPNNSLRPLLGCGVAAAIAASFNTPMAGVIFAMEVVLMEYTITGFIPVILASISGSAITQLIFHESTVFSVTTLQISSLLELPYIAFAGIVIALFAVAFIRLQLLLSLFQHQPIALRLTFAGMFTGIVALFIPQIMGVGYDTVQAAMYGELGLGTLLIILVSKLIVTSVSTGLGMPGGVIGPTLFIGACLGGILGIIGFEFYPQETATPGIYVLLGMSAMMAAVLNAPLAALIAVLELTYNPNMIFPTMLIIVVACITTRQVFHCEGLFLSLLTASGRSVHPAPMYQVLSRAGVLSVMDKRFVCSPQRINQSDAKKMLTTHPMWIVIEDPDKEKYLLRAADLASWLDTCREQEPQTAETDTIQQVDLLEIPGRRHRPMAIPQLANLYEAQQLLLQGSEALYVERISSMPTPQHKSATTATLTTVSQATTSVTAPSSTRPLNSQVMGIITQGTIENFYQI